MYNKSKYSAGVLTGNWCEDAAADEHKLTEFYGQRHRGTLKVQEYETWRQRVDFPVPLNIQESTISATEAIAKGHSSQNSIHDSNAPPVEDNHGKVTHSHTSLTVQTEGPLCFETTIQFTNGPLDNPSTLLAVDYFEKVLPDGTRSALVLGGGLLNSSTSWHEANYNAVAAPIHTHHPGHATFRNVWRLERYDQELPPLERVQDGTVKYGERFYITTLKSEFMDTHYLKSQSDTTLTFDHFSGRKEVSLEAKKSFDAVWYIVPAETGLNKPWDVNRPVMMNDNIALIHAKTNATLFVQHVGKKNYFGTEFEVACHGKLDAYRRTAIVAADAHFWQCRVSVPKPQ